MVLVIDNYDSFTYNLLQLIEENSAEGFEVLKYGEVNGRIISEFDKILISPGPGIPADFPNLEKWVREYGHSKSFLGVCLGHEAIALAFGARLVKLEGVFHGITKTCSILDREEYLFKGVPSGFEGGLYHSWALDETTFPEDLKITAKAHDGVIMAFSHKEYDCKGLQFHPESIMTKEGERILRNWLSHKS